MRSTRPSNSTKLGVLEEKVEVRSPEQGIAIYKKSICLRAPPAARLTATTQVATRHQSLTRSTLRTILSDSRGRSLGCRSHSSSALM